MADPFSILHGLAQASQATLTTTGLSGHIFSYRDLYSAFGFVALLAMFNGLLVMACLALAALKYANPRLLLLGKATFLLSLTLQGILGLAPIALIVHAWTKGEGASLAVYGMPLLQLAFITLVIFYQIRVVVLYARVRKSVAAGT